MAVHWHGNVLACLKDIADSFAKAIRMIKDLGLHLNMHKQGNVNVEPEDLEARKRLFLSAYSWDK